MKDTRLQQLFKILTEVESYSRAIGKLEFDMSCVAPPEGLEQAGEDMALLGQRVHTLTHSKRYEKLISSLHDDPGELTLAQRKTVEHLFDAWEKTKNQSARFAYQRELALNKAYSDWLKAKKASDFSLFRDSLAAVTDYTRRDIDLRDEKKSTYYNSCLDDYEKGGSEAQLDAFFAALKERIVPLIRRITTEGKSVRTDFLSRPCPIGEQESFSRWLLELEGLRKDALVLMTTEHPFTTSFGPHDVRVTTHYYENAFLSNIFTTLHEGGHALFMQNEPEEFYVNYAHDSMTSAMHECISRFYENIIGRSEAFIRFIYPRLRQVSPSVMEGVSERELYEGVNVARPSLIRTESDELTYGIHIMIRYEIEKELVNGRITVDQVPALWNAKYREYLGVEVPDDARGCLQDVHWSGGFGYFPSYALGNAYGAQILRTMEKDFDVFAAVERGELWRVKDWLTEHVFSIASVTDPDEWIRAITGESLNVHYFLDYLEEKFTEIYGL
ncbi:MAG: carboxypeptidase M32 [Oscillospiraceae bacterium]|nr:carboxypeptidase M32 [Oscillospiraceae bacterium]